MASLLDTIRGNLSQQATEQLGMTDEASRIRKLLGARSGKAASQVAPEVASSNLGEAAALDQTRAQSQQLAQAGQLQSAEIEQTQRGLAEQERQGQERIDLQQKANTLQNKIQTDQLLNDLSRDKASLNLDRDKAKLEQVSQNLAFQDKQYVDRLQREADMKGLQSRLAFNEELSRAIFSDNLDILREDMAQKAANAADSRLWDKSLASQKLVDMINADYAAGQAEAKRSRYEAAGKMVSAGSQAASTNWKNPYNKSEDKKSNTDASPGGSTGGSYTDYSGYT